MARRIIRRRRVSRQAQPQHGEVRPQGPSLPGAKPLPATRVMIAAPGSIATILSSKLAGSPAVKIAAMARDDAGAVEKMITEDADVAAIHMRLGGELQGLDTARNVARACPEAGILILVDNLDGVDLRRRARMFGTAWSYALLSSAESGHAFGEMVSGVGRGIHWIDPPLRRVLEAVWQVASQGRDLEMANALGELESDEEKKPPLLEPEPPKRGGIQTMRAGNSGVGSTGFGVNRAA